jgi:GNAT superfamily N-acetyltransferase
MHGPVSGEEVAEIEHFFFSRDSAVSIDLCPHADSSLREVLMNRGYRIADMSNVLVRDLRSDENWSVAVLVEPTQEEIEYARTLTCGFFGRDLITEDELRLGRTLYHMPSAQPLIARFEGQAAGACGLSVRNGVGSFWGDATLPAFRNRGVHSAMIRARLNEAAARGCDLATAGTQPGSGSQRNYQRLGFDVAYTKMTLVALPR